MKKRWPGMAFKLYDTIKNIGSYEMFPLKPTKPTLLVFKDFEEEQGFKPSPHLTATSSVVLPIQPSHL
jgi:hypothetical protein